MNKRKYRLFVICCLVLDLLVMLISGYRYLDRKIPDEIQISRGKKTEDVTEVLSTPLLHLKKQLLFRRMEAIFCPVNFWVIFHLKK